MKNIKRTPITIPIFLASFSLLLVALLVALLGAGASGIQPVSALPEVPNVPPIPHQFYGRVTINNTNVSPDTLVSAWCAGVKVVESQVFEYNSQTWYGLEVLGDDPATVGVKEGCTPGETINFKIGSTQTSQTAAWAEGGSNPDFHLSITFESKLFIPMVSR